MVVIPMTWAAQAMRLPVWWYVTIERGSGAEFPVSGDDTLRQFAMFFAETGIAHGSRPLPLRA